MTAPTLPETLARLAQLLPERVPYAGQAVTQVRYAGAKRQVRPDEPESLVWLEMALREECAARGWSLNQQADPHPVHPSWRATIYTPQFRSAQGSSPAQALALALLSALGGEGT